ALHFLTEALWAAIEQHDAEPGVRLYVQQRTGKTAALLLPGAPAILIDEYADSEAFGRKARMRLRRVIVERCLYGVDLDPLAVELARLSLWVETLDAGLPFSFLDHKVKVGNALVGAWLDTFGEYPLAAWLREGGDKTHPTSVHYAPGTWTKAIKDRLADSIKPDMRLSIDIRGAEKSQAVPLGINPELNAFAEQLRLSRAMEPIHASGDEDEKRQLYHEFLERSDYRTLKAAMDRWCALWFWPADQLDLAPLPTTFGPMNAAAEAIVAALADEMHFFHWQLEFPDVLHTRIANANNAIERRPTGFDAVLGNPPWDVQKPDSREFFTRYDPIYRTYNKQDGLRRQRELFAHEPEIERAWLAYNARFKALGNWVANVAHPWGDGGDPDGTSITLTRSRGESDTFHATWRKQRLLAGHFEHPFRYQGSADLNSYKLFAEAAHHLLRDGGRLGLILPSALGSDSGSRALRMLFLDQCQWEWDFVWMNTQKIFAIDGRYKFGAIIVQRGGSTARLTAAFSRTDPQEWGHITPTSAGVVTLPRETIQRLSPASLALVEPGTARDLALLEKLYDPARAILLGSDAAEGWHVTYATEFHMTNDSALFHPRPWWEERGYQPDAYGRWRNDDGGVALPLYQGRMLSHFDFSEKGWVSGSGSRTLWRDIDPTEKVMEPQFLMDANIYAEHVPSEDRGLRIGMLDIRRATDTRTMYSALLPDFPFGNTVPVLKCFHESIGFHLCLTAMLNSFSYDYALRQRHGGAHLNYFILEETPLLHSFIAMRYPLAQWAARLTLIHPLWAREWLAAKQAFPAFGARPWRAWWATTPTERLRLRCMIDAVVAHVWGQTEDDFAWLLRDDKDDPKGFWRVDKELPVEQRQTTQTLAAFRHLLAVGVERFCAEEWWPAGSPARAFASQAEIAAGWAECEGHARVLAATDPLRGVGAEPATGATQSLWRPSGPEQERLPGTEPTVEQLRLGQADIEGN
nr:hypothetical protein [Ktedonobacterales bacterium]